MGQEGLRFVVFGATGAVGAATVRALLGNDNSKAVFTVGRRHLDVAADPRLHQIVLPTLDNMDKDQETINQLQGSVDIAIIALGTTRSAAGDAAAFKKVDVEYVAAAARLSKAVGAYRYRCRCRYRYRYWTRPTGAHSLALSLALSRSLARQAYGRWDSSARRAPTRPSGRTT